MNKYDVIIIGGSYAGLSAAMALGRSRRNVLIIDAGDPCNSSTPYSHNFLTQDGVAPAKIAAIAKDQVQHYPTVHWQYGHAHHIKVEKGLFEVTLDGGRKEECRRVILATGLKDLLPEIPGFRECWGKTIIHCPYCHGYEFKDEETGILAPASQAVEMVKLISNWTGHLKLFLTGEVGLEEEEQKSIQQKGIRVICQPIVEVVHEQGVLEKLIMEDGSQQAMRALYARLPTEQKAAFVKDLSLAQMPSGHIQADMFGKTSIEGIYAVGDCAHPMRSVATAVYTGNIAGAMINKELIEEDF